MRASSASRSTSLPRRSTYLRTRACETATSSGTIAPGRAKRARRMAFGTFGLRAERARRELDGTRRRRRRAEAGATYAFTTAFACPVRHQAADLDTADRHAERDRRGSRRRLDRRLGRRRLVVAASSSAVRSPAQAPRSPRPPSQRARTRPRSRGARRRRAGAAPTGGRRPSRFQCRRENRGSLVTTASTPASSTRARSSGSSTVHVTTAAPRACARARWRRSRANGGGRRRGRVSPRSRGRTHGRVTRRSVRSARRPSGARGRCSVMRKMPRGNVMPDTDAGSVDRRDRTRTFRGSRS